MLKSLPTCLWGGLGQQERRLGCKTRVRAVVSNFLAPTHKTELFWLKQGRPKAPYTPTPSLHCRGPQRHFQGTLGLRGRNSENLWGKTKARLNMVGWGRGNGE